MIDTEQLAEIIKGEISSKISQTIDVMLNDPTWVTKMESMSVNAVQHRILSKFKNISEIPGINQAFRDAVQHTIAQGHITAVQEMVDSDHVHRIVKDSVENSIQQYLADLSLDQSWLERLQQQIDRHMAARIAQQLSLHDVPSLVAAAAEKHMKKWVEDIKSQSPVPNIVDVAETTQVTVMEGTVVIENEIAANRATIVNSVCVKGTTDVNDLIVRGQINVDNHSWDELAERISDRAFGNFSDQWRTTLINNVLDKAKADGIDFASVTCQGQPLVIENRLGPQITESSLVQVGTLRSLAVDGNTTLNQTLSVHRNRVGINTNSPEMAFHVWDEEVTITAGKISKNRAWIGTARRQDLSIGVDKQSAIDIDAQGLVTIKKLRVDRFQIGHAPQVPGWSGTRGDFILNSDPKPDQPFAWVCLGAFKWQPLRAA